MGLDVYLKCSCCGSELYNGSTTHNLAKMATAVGLYEELWRPEEHGIKMAAQLVKPLRRGLQTLKTYPDRAQKFNAANGWGTYDDLVQFVEEYLAACEKHLEATVRVSR